MLTYIASRWLSCSQTIAYKTWDDNRKIYCFSYCVSILKEESEEQVSSSIDSDWVIIGLMTVAKNVGENQVVSGISLFTRTLMATFMMIWSWWIHCSWGLWLISSLSVDLHWHSLHLEYLAGPCSKDRWRWKVHAIKYYCIGKQTGAGTYARFMLFLSMPWQVWAS